MRSLITMTWSSLPSSWDKKISSRIPLPQRLKPLKFSLKFNWLLSWVGLLNRKKRQLCGWQDSNQEITLSIFSPKGWWSAVIPFALNQVNNTLSRVISTPILSLNTSKAPERLSLLRPPNSLTKQWEGRWDHPWVFRAAVLMNDFKIARNVMNTRSFSQWAKEIKKN